MNDANQLSNRVLLVEDDIQLSDVVKRYLVSLGYRVDVLSNGYRAAELVEHHNYLVAFLDILMPGQSGLDTLRDIRDGKKGKVLPVIMLTNVKNDAMLERARQMEVLDYLVKVDTDLEKIKEILERIQKRLTV